MRKFILAASLLSVSVTWTLDSAAQPQQPPSRPRGVAPSPGGPPPDIAALRADPTRQLQQLWQNPLLAPEQKDQLLQFIGPSPVPPSPPPPQAPPPKVVATRIVDGVQWDCIARTDQVPHPSAPMPQAPGTSAVSEPIDTPPTEGTIGPTAPTPQAPSADAGRCPDNTVPIHHEADQGNAPRFDFNNKDHGLGSPQGNNGPPLPVLEVPHRYAHAQALLDNRGIEAKLNVWGPKPASQNDMTLSQTWIVAARTDGKLQTVESGWQVWEGWGTKSAVPFIYFTTNSYDQNEGPAKGGCYNKSATCNQFVMWTSDIILGRALPASSPTGQQTTLALEWFLKPNGNWWVKINGVWVGYYPKETFGEGPLPAGGQIIDFGGEATGLLPIAEMGSGRFARDGFGFAAFQSDLAYYDMIGKLVSLSDQSNPLKESTSDPICYTFQFGGLPQVAGASGLYFFFGGPGTNHFGAEPKLPTPPPEICRGP
jgi:Neprosin